MQAAELFKRALAQLDERAASIKPGQWHAATPDSEWDVHDLFHHVTYETAWVPPLLEGKTITEVGDSLEGDLLGDDPQAAWSKYRKAAEAATSAHGALDGVAHLSRGDVPARDYIMEVFSDLVIHTWDLSRAIGAEEKLDPELVKACYDHLLPQAEDWRAGGAFAAAVKVDDAADLQTKLLALTGRKA